MNVVTVDFETYYDKDYSLSKLQTDAYILDPRFEVIGVGIKLNDEDSTWHPGADHIRTIPPGWWEDKAVLCHNTLFDGFILSQVYGVKPKMWLDTLAMGRAVYPWLNSHSLASLTSHLNIGLKGTEVLNALGKRMVDFTPEELWTYGAYCRNDADITKKLFDAMEDSFPPLEYCLVDATIRMFTEPKFQLDSAKLVTYRDDIIANKEALLTGAGVDKDAVMSNPKFAAMLEQLGVEPPLKISKTTNKATYAFAKTDKELTELQEHPDSRVQTLVAARLGNKTTIAETRAQMLIDTAGRGVGLPVYLNFWGAKTTGRYSGGNKINLQNLPARGTDRVIREALVAPEGYSVVVGDSSNIELRVNLALSGQTDMLDMVREYDSQGDAAVSDLYCDFSSTLYGKTVTKNDKLERTVGKVSELSLGYGAGWSAFQGMLRIQAKIDFSEQECRRVVDLYRNTHQNIVKLWRRCGTQTLQQISMQDVMQSVDVNGWVLTTHNGFALPNHLGVVYHDLRRNGDGRWEYQQGRSRIGIYDGKVVENLCQHVARHIVMWQLAKVSRQYPVALTVHDEIVCVVPTEQAQDCAAFMLESLRTAPKWCRGAIPLNGEVGIGKSYAEAK